MFYFLALVIGPMYDIIITMFILKICNLCKKNSKSNIRGHYFSFSSILRKIDANTFVNVFNIVFLEFKERHAFQDLTSILKLCCTFASFQIISSFLTLATCYFVLGQMYNSEQIVAFQFDDCKKLFTLDSCEQVHNRLYRFLDILVMFIVSNFLSVCYLILLIPCIRNKVVRSVFIIQEENDNIYLDNVNKSDENHSVDDHDMHNHEHDNNHE